MFGNGTFLYAAPSPDPDTEWSLDRALPRYDQYFAPLEPTQPLEECIERLMSGEFTGPDALRLLRLCDWKPERAFATAAAADWHPRAALDLAREA